MATKSNAVLEALRKAQDWIGGAVVVKNDDGSYEAYPGAYMNDISFSGSRNVVFTVENACDVLGSDPAEYGDADLLAYINENVDPGVE